LKEELGVPGEVDLALLSRFTDLIVDETEVDEEVPDIAIVRDVTESAARAVIVMREDEGRRLRIDLEERLASIETTMTRIVDLAPVRLLAERDRMRRVVAELLEGVPLDEDRIAREIAYI